MSAIKVWTRNTLSKIYGQLRSSQTPRSGLRVLMYHALGTSADGDSTGAYSIAPPLFEEHMRCLAEHWRECLVRLDGESSHNDGLQIAVTFDDGYQDNWLVGFPLLQELGIPFTVFVWTGAVAEGRTGFLSTQELRSLAAQPGVSIGSHGVSHYRLTECSEKDLRAELVDSKAYLEDLLGQEVTQLSYPHGAVNQTVRAAAAKAGYRIAACSRFNINRLDRDPLLLCRTDIWGNDNLPVFQQKLHGDWDWLSWRSTDPAKLR
jgi:peptidoglycan/xylan/chitin deacetylase (PgdA/CDA1 family)